MNKITQYLNQHVVGNVFDKTPIRDAYANDYSIIKNVPRFVAIPENVNDIRKIVRFCDQLAMREYRLPVTIRGNGHDKTGAAVGGGIVISTEHLNHIQEIDVRGQLVRVQAGVTLGQLNSALSLHGLTLPIDTNPNETIGGLIGNCPSDNYSGKYGGIYNYIERAEVVLANGDLIQTSILSHRALKHKKGQSSNEGALYRNIDRTIDEHQDVIAKMNPKSLDSAGYASIAITKMRKNFDLLPLFFASQGTLGIISEVILRCELLPPQPKRMFVHFNSLRTAIDFMQFAKSLRPLTLNFYDSRIFQNAITAGKKSAIITRKIDTGFVVTISFNDKPRKSKKKIKKCLKHLPKNIFAVAEDDKNTHEFDELKNMLLSYLNDGIRGERAPLVDGTRIDQDQLSGFIEDLHALEKTYKTELPLFGSFASSNYSVRPEIQLDQIAGRQFALKFLRDFSFIVKERKGSLTGGIPEGAVKPLVAKLPDEQRELYAEIKNAFDPHNILNPDVKLGADSKTTIRHLRTYYNYYVVE